MLEPRSVSAAEECPERWRELVPIRNTAFKARPCKPTDTTPTASARASISGDPARPPVEQPT
eukprot:1412398-Rhodomonas_salina.1